MGQTFPMQPRQMVRPRIKEISGVDHPAHQTEGWLMMKSVDAESAEILAEAEAIASDNYAEADFAKESHMDMDFDEEFSKELDGMAPMVKAQFLKQQEQIASLNEEREEMRFEEMAKSLLHLPRVTVSEFGPVLRKAAYNTDEETFGALFEVLKSADNAIAQSGLYREIGTGMGGSPDSPAGTIEAIAKSLVSEDSSLTYAEAVVKAAEANPDLYAQHRQEA